MKTLAGIATLTTCLALTAAPALAGGCSSSKSSKQAHRAHWHQDAKPDIVDTAVSAGSFNTLVAAVKAADLVDVLKSDGPFTVFAPTDAAFAKLPEGTIAALLKDPEALRTVLTYHVIPRELSSEDVADRRRAKTVLGDRVRFSGSDTLKVNDINIVQADIKTSNGVIHVIDTVMLPPERVGH